MNNNTTDLSLDASLSTEIRVDAVCRRFEAAWKSGEQPRPEDFVTGWEGEERLVLLRELILIDMDYRKKAGETPSPENYLHYFELPSGIAPTDEILPRSFGRYTLHKLLGKGGMGRVFLAHDGQLERLVALKMPNPVEGVAGWRDRFLTEARAAATLTHPNVCPVHDVGEVDGQPYLTMAYIEGETLATRLEREKKLAPAAAVEMVRTVARAMHEAHRRGIIHRDLKPANLMLDSASRPIVMDFGLAIRSTASDDLRLTLTGVALGTPAYMSPEQAGGDSESIGPTSDVYSLGVVLFEMLTGRPPFLGKSFGKLLAKIERDPPPAPSSLNPEVDLALEAIVLTALAKSPAERFTTAGELADALDKYLEGDRDQIVSLYSKPYQVPDATSEYRTGHSGATTINFRKRRGWPRWVVGAAAFMLAVIAAGVIYVETDYGQLVIQLNDPNAKVDVRVNGQEVTLDTDGGKSVRVRAGTDYKLIVSGTDFETVADTYTVKRGDVTLARVTLKPKPDVAKNRPDNTLKGDQNSSAQTKNESLKSNPVSFPKQATLIEAPGWQILTDAAKEEMQKWLDERKRDKHSVTWLDAVQVGDKPLFSATAALDDREPNWVALLDVPGIEANNVALLGKRLDIGTHLLISLSGFARENELRASMLFTPGDRTMGRMGITSFDGVQVNLEKYKGYAIRLLRPFPFGGDQVRCGISMESDASKGGMPGFDLTEAELLTHLEKRRKEGNRLASMSAFEREGQLRFAVTFRPDQGKATWEAQTGLVPSALNARLSEMSAKGFTPTCVTAYPWDGAVRYCVVWVKEPPRHVEYPKGSTLVEIPGWQVLTNATKDEMRKWLDERKRDKHSVTWLDAIQVADKPVFSAVAALDDRAPDWLAFLDYESPKGKILAELFSKVIDLKKYRPVSISAYDANGLNYAAVLWEAGGGEYIFGLEMDPWEHDKLLATYLKNGLKLHVLRPYLIQKSVVQYAVNFARKPDEKNAYGSELTAARLEEFLEKQRAEGNCPSSLAAAPQDGELRFAATATNRPAGTTWEVDTNLTSQTYARKATEMAKRGFIPTCTTAYPWDGAVRYCAVWVKEPPRPAEYPKSPTLVETPGWQIFTNATKDDMRKWLDERKKAKHSVTWLDASQVGDKPVFSAIAATDDRHANWQAFLDMPVENFGNGELNKLVGPKTDQPLSASGYMEDGKVKSVSLWRKEGLPFYIDPEATMRGLKIAEEQLRLGSGVIRGIRPYPAGNGIAIGVFGHKAIGEKGTYLIDATREQLEEFVKDQQSSGQWINCFAAYLKEGKLLYAIVSSSNPRKIEWKLEQGLTAGQLQSGTTELAIEKFHPSCVTAYPWDGAVRYCVIWVKELPKSEAPAKKQ